MEATIRKEQCECECEFTQSEIVVSGISGRFPEAENLDEFWTKLLGGVDMVTDDDRRWTRGTFDLPTRSGKLRRLDQFDADYFSIHAKQADFMDPQVRMLLEVTHEAVVDAGVNPQELGGQNVGVFIGASASESETEWVSDLHTTHGYTATGCHRTMFSNRLSFAFDFKGPSFTIDTACSSSLMALDQAFTALQSGHCDSAIVGGTHLCLDPKISRQFNKLNMLSPQGKCQSFDAAGDGYVRSEAVVVIFLQRKTVARRVYASILGVKTNTDGHKKEGVTFPSGQMQKVLLEATYKEAGVDPRDVVYVEAHGTGTPAGDPQELNAIAEVFCPERDAGKPLLIGSVKSNMGHAEPASGLCGMVKVLLAMQHGVIPGNLHYKTPNPKINALQTGQLKVVSQNTEWHGGIVGINSFGFGGANVHAILQSNYESPSKKHQQVSMEVPFIIPFSGRSKDSVELVLKEITMHKNDNGKIRLLLKIHSKNIPGNQFRGFAVVPENQTETEIFVQEIGAQSESPRVCFIFNGMGSQWAGMGKSLMKFQTCKESLQKSAAILKSKNLDLFVLLINVKEERFENVLNSFVCIAAVQIALVDLLTSLNIKPDEIIGHSVGELGAAYADQCLTAEQVLFTAHARGQAILEMCPRDCAMAAVGLTWEEAKQKCPEGIYPACHNAKDSVSVSGPAKLIDDFVDQLQKEGIFARKVNSSNQAFHSKYIEAAKFQFRESLENIIRVAAPRSSRWISSSIPESQWNSDLAKMSSADYHVNNLISPVLFQEALEKVPTSSVVIEIGPHCLLQAILKRSLPNCYHIGLVNKTHKDGLVFLSSSIGKIFNFGLNPLLSNLYPEIQFQFPVPLETPSLSSVVSKCWDHSKSWNFPLFASKNSTGSNVRGKEQNSGGLNFEISLDNEQDGFYSGHKIDGRIIFPQTGLIVLAWRAWAEIHHGNHGNVDFEKLPFAIENFMIFRATLMPKKGELPLKFNINITNGTGDFRIEENGVLVASGTIRSPLDDDFISVDPISVPGENTQEILLNQQDFYKNLRLRGYEYSGVFQGVKRASLDLDWAEIEFSNWVAFLDAMLHPLVSCHADKKSILLPTRIKKLVVDPQKFWEHSRKINGDSKMPTSTIPVPVFCNPNLKLLSCKGVQIQGQKLEAAPRNQQQNSSPVFEKFEFTPHFDDPKSNPSSIKTDDHCLQTLIGLVLENLAVDELNILEIAQNSKNMISPLVQKFCKGQPKKTFDAAVVVLDFVDQEPDEKEEQDNSGTRLIQENPSTEVFDMLKSESENRNLLIVHDLTDFKQVVQNKQFEIGIGIFVLLQIAKTPDETRFQQEIPVLEDINVTKVAHKISPEFDYHLFKTLRKHQSKSKDSQKRLSSNVSVDTCTNSSDKTELNRNYEWIENLKVEMKKATEDKIDQGFRINVTSRSFDSDQFNPSGILGLVNSLRRELGGHALRCFFINDSNTPILDFDFENPDQELQKLIEKDLLMNVYQNGAWGSFRFFPLPAQTTKPVERALLNVQKRGDLSSFQWFESPLKYSKEADLCSVYYSGLNFRDVMLASGKLNPGSLPNNVGNEDNVLGMEFSGLDSKGKRVTGIVTVKSMATCVVADPGFLWQVPSSWSLADADTVPVAYATAYYALVVRGRLKDGESVLIHGGAGAVGLASISVALSKNCRVFATVGSQEKRQFLKNYFPQLNDSCFANSRNTTFLQHIMKETNGRGVDVVLNSLAGDKLLASIDCVAQHGRFLEIGKVDIFNDTNLGMSIFLKDVSFTGILLDSLTSESRNKHKVWRLVQHGIESGVVQPLKHTIFSDGVDDVEKAFRFMANGKHIGKILIQIRKEQEKPDEKIIHAVSRTFFDPSKSYIILGGLGGFGLELCGWMIGRGATKLMLISRSGVTTGYQKLCLKRWEKMSGVSVFVSTIDATTHEGATKILKTALQHFKGAPIGGIFNLAMVLRDGVLENQTPENFEAVAKPKINASMAMDKASRILAPELEYFVCFSSVVSGRGAPGLSNYAYANSALERICEQRKSEGLSGLAVMWGAIGDVGVLVDKFKGKEDQTREGTAPQRIASCLNTLDVFLQSSVRKSCSTLSSFVPASKSVAEEKAIKSNWVELVARVLGLETAELEKNPQKPFSAFGMDSIMAIEMQQVIDVTSGHKINPSDIQNLSMSKLREVMPSISKTQTVQNLENPSKKLHQNGCKKPCASSSNSELEFQFEEKTQPKEKYDVESAGSDFSCLELQPKRQSQNVFSTARGNLVYAVSYILSALSLTLIYFIFSPVSLITRLSVKFFLWLLYNSTQIKLVDGIFESVNALRNTNSVQILKFSGQPNKDNLVRLLEDRLFGFSSGSNSDAPETGKEFYHMFERLKWSIEIGFLFCYWRKHENFNFSHHVIFERLETETCDVESEIPRLVDLYTNTKWPELVGSRPWWEFRIVYSKRAMEFLMVFVWNHAYGDGRSGARLFQTILGQAEVATPALKKNTTTNDESSPGDTCISTLRSVYFRMLKQLTNVLGKTKQIPHKAHFLISNGAHIFLDNWETRSNNFIIKSNPCTASVFGKFSLSKLKFLKDPKTGKPFNLNVVVMSICARVFRRIMKESKGSGPAAVMVSSTWAPWEHDAQVPLVNDFVMIPIKIPLTFDSNFEQVLDDDDDDDGDGDIKNIQQTLAATQEKFAEVDKLGNLVLIKQFVQKISGFPLPLLRFVFNTGFRSSFIYSNVVASLPKTTPLFPGCKFKWGYGASSPGPLQIIAITDTANNLLTITVTVSQQIMNNISPEFHSRFVLYFEQEIKRFQNLARH